MTLPPSFDLDITLTPRRDAFDAGPAPMSTATPSCCCCCCCCCLNTMLGVVGYETAELGAVAEKNDRSGFGAQLIAVLQFPALIAAGIWFAVVAADWLPADFHKSSAGLWAIVLVAASLYLGSFMALSLVSYRLAGEQTVTRLRVLRQLKKILISTALFIVELPVTLFTFLFAQLASPFSFIHGRRRGLRAAERLLSDHPEPT